MIHVVLVRIFELYGEKSILKGNRMWYFSEDQFTST